MTRTERIRQIYSIVIGVFAVALGIALICVAAQIYYSGRGTDTVYTREIVAGRLKIIAIPFMILAGGIICGAVFPVKQVKAAKQDENAVWLLAAKIKGGDGEEYQGAYNRFVKLVKVRLTVWGVALSATLACTIATLCYVLNAANFADADITASIFKMMQNVLPCIVVMFAFLIAAAITNGVLAKKQVAELKTLLKLGEKNAAPVFNRPEILNKAEFILSHKITLWAVRAVILVVSVTFVFLGIFNGGAHDVLVKAINICTECIGLG